MQLTMINWAKLTWGPMSGCEQVSTECKNCYAEGIAEQKKGSPAFPNGFGLTLRRHKFKEPAAFLRREGPSLIFCNSMSDPGITGEGRLVNQPEGALTEIPDDFLDEFWRTMAVVKEHRYQVLTKRPHAVLAYLKRRNIKIPPSVWMGVTIGHIDSAWRLDVLREFRELGAKVLFVSAEPLLGSLRALDLRGVDWLISGGESGNHFAQIGQLRIQAESLTGEPKRKALALAASHEQRFLVRRATRSPLVTRTPEGERWVRELRDNCARAGTAFWHKQWGGTNPHMGGRLLDGREHNGLPVHIEGAMPEGYTHKLTDPAAPAPVTGPAKREQLHLAVL